MHLALSARQNNQEKNTPKGKDSIARDCRVQLSDNYFNEESLSIEMTVEVGTILLGLPIMHSKE